MIVRIATEGQYEVAASDVDALNVLDNAAVDACQAADETKFHEIYGQLLEYVRTKGALIDGDELVGSDIILPPPDITLAEAQTEFQGEGLIPG